MRDLILSPCPERFWGPPSLLSNAYQGLFPWGYSDRGVKLTTRPHLVTRSKNAWSYTVTPPVRLHGVVLIKIKHSGDSTFTFTFTTEMKIQVEVFWIVTSYGDVVW